MIGVGLDSAEIGYPPSLFRDVYRMAAAEGLHRVAHAGEEAGPDYVWEALDVLEVERIDHGIRAMEDGNLVRRLRAERDDPAYFGGYVDDNYRAVARELGLDDAALRTLAVNSFDAWFAPAEQRERWKAEVAAGTGAN